MSKKKPSSNEEWSDIARELSELPGWEIEAIEPSDTPGWEKITYTNGIIYEQPLPPKQIELFDFPKSESSLDERFSDAVSDSPIKINPELLQEAKLTPPPGNVNQYYPGRRDTAYYRFSYRLGRRVKHVHIRGGNSCSQAGQANAQQIREMIARGYSLAEILKTIAKF